jgi:membrane associated rhomboid family serine protease
MFPLRSDVAVSRFPTVVLALIAANVSAFLWQASVGLPASIEVFGAIPRAIGLGAHFNAGFPPALTLLTAMFLHASPWHLVSNLWFLWIFGAGLEDRLGHGSFLIFYLLCGLIAGLAQVLADPTSPLPVVGASGAIAGILGAYFLLFPGSRILTLLLPPFSFLLLRLFDFLYLPAIVFLGVWFLLQLFSLPSQLVSGVAFAAHVGGFVAGLLLVRVFAAGRQRRLTA